MLWRVASGIGFREMTEMSAVFMARRGGDEVAGGLFGASIVQHVRGPAGALPGAARGIATR